MFYVDTFYKIVQGSKNKKFISKNLEFCDGKKLALTYQSFRFNEREWNKKMDFITSFFRHIKNKIIMNNTLIFNFMKPGKGAELKIEYLLNYYKEHNIRILRNVYIPISDNKTTAIDVLMIHPLGIFVFESKDYSEWIYGNENANQWTQTLVGNGKSYKNHFYNPIKQNEGHIKVLKKYIGEVNTFSFVVFTNACEFKNITRTNNITYLIHCRELNKTLDSIFRDNPSRIISNKDIEILYDLLLCFSIRVSNDKNML